MKATFNSSVKKRQRRGYVSLIARIATAIIFTGMIGGQEGISQAVAQPAAVGSTSQQQARRLGMWTTPADLCAPDGACLVGANAAVLPGRRVLFYFYPSWSNPNSTTLLLSLDTGQVTDVRLPFATSSARDIFCSGISVMPDGRVLVTGGNLPQTSDSGTFNTTIFDPNSASWLAGANMNYARWYPSTVELEDGRMLEVAGNDETGRVVAALESYDANTNTWTVLPASADLPRSALHPTAYPRLVLLPSGKVFLAAPDAKTYQFDAVAATWTFVANTNFGSRFYAPHVLLPGLQKVLVAGGSPTEPGAGKSSTNTAEVIDFSASPPLWKYTGSMTYARINENLVLLADGTVLAVGGGSGSSPYAYPVLTPELYDPLTGSWSVMAAQGVQRTYHSTAVLLPDGRVLSAGSNDNLAMQHTYEIFSPPYMFAGTRPVITSVPASVTYGRAFTILTPDAASITRVALVKPGATTHADNMDQRYVDLRFQISSGQITATAPPSGGYAPPGNYMLVIVNSSRIPSVMQFISIR